MRVCPYDRQRRQVLTTRSRAPRLAPISRLRAPMQSLDSALRLAGLGLGLEVSWTDRPVSDGGRFARRGHLRVCRASRPSSMWGSPARPPR